MACHLPRLGSAVGGTPILTSLADLGLRYMRPSARAARVSSAAASPAWLEGKLEADKLGASVPVRRSLIDGRSHPWGTLSLALSYHLLTIPNRQWVFFFYSKQFISRAVRACNNYGIRLRYNCRYSFNIISVTVIHYLYFTYVYVLMNMQIYY